MSLPKFLSKKVDSASLFQKLAREVLSSAPLYHGSPEEVDVLQPRREHGDPMVPDVIFASPFRDFALAYSGREWGDRDFNQSIRRRHGQREMIMREMRPNAIEDTFKGVPGYLYHLGREGFERTKRPGSTWEVVRTKPVKPLRAERIADVLRALENEPTVKLERYNPRHRETRAAIRRMVSRMNEMENPSRYRNWRLKGVPDAIRQLFEEEEARLKTPG